LDNTQHRRKKQSVVSPVSAVAHLKQTN